MGPKSTVALYRGVARAAQILPSGAAYGAAKSVGWVAPTFARRRSQQIARHQRRIDPRLPPSGPVLRRQVRKTFSSYLCSFVDSFRLPSMSAAEIAGRVDIEGWEHVEAAFALGKGIVMTMPHLGVWDLGGAYFAARAPLTVVAEALEPPELFEWFVHHRNRLGITVVRLGPQATGPLVAALRQNRALGLLCDRDIAGGGIEVDFFGERTTVPGGPATLALRTGAPILPNAAVYGTGSRIRAIVRPPIEFERTGRLRDDVTALTQLVVRELETLIRAYPHQWHVLQPNWPSDPGYRSHRQFDSPTSG